MKQCEYLQQQPPRKQVLCRGNLSWSNDIDESISDIERVLIYVRRVRNNLFHGGKFPTPDGVVDEPGRDKQLIQECLTVLRAVLKLPSVQNVAQNFDPEE
ncbi:MAG: hypothetical protein O2968_14075 [Acidobacteria bacterium]|nr:hypothetical protein [Acidobacteriota bacterium]